MEEASTIVPELFYDLIARIIPASVLVVLYGFSYLQATLSVQCVFFAAVLSYIIGMILNIFADSIWRLVFTKEFVRARFYKINSTCYNDLMFWNMARAKDTKLVDRNVITKLLAEKNMFKSLSIVSLILAVKLPEVFLQFSLPCMPCIIRVLLLAFSIGSYAFIYTVHKWLCYSTKNIK